MASSSSTKDKEEVKATMEEEVCLPSPTLVTEELRWCEAHSTVILAQVDQDVYRKLGINLTCEPQYQTKKLYHK